MDNYIYNNCCTAGLDINLAAVTVASTISQSMEPSEIALLGAFFTILGDSLACISIAKERCCDCIKERYDRNPIPVSPNQNTDSSSQNSSNESNDTDPLNTNTN